MRKESLNTFVSLLENIVISEASTAMDIMRQVPGAETLLKKIHGSRDLPHDVGYQQVDKISWSDIKGQKYRSDKTSWVLVKGERGMGAIKAQGTEYSAMAPNQNGEIEIKNAEKGGDVLDFLKARIGRLKAYYVGSFGKEHSEKIASRIRRKPVPIEQYSGEENFTKLMLRKFKPIWIKAIDGAINDTKGWVQNMIKNHSFQKAKHKIEKLQYLEQMVEKLRDGDDPLESKERYSDPYAILRNAMHNAVMMTAHHYYPELSKGFRARERTYGSSGTHRLNDSDAIEALFNAIRNGETDKLSTMIGFFKRGLIAS